MSSTFLKFTFSLAAAPGLKKNRMDVLAVPYVLKVAYLRVEK